MNKQALLFGLLVSFSSVTQAEEMKVRTLLATREIPVSVTLDRELDQFFGSNGCQLPASLKKVLRDRKKQGFLPEDLKRILGSADLQTGVRKIPATHVRGVLLTAAFLMPDGRERPIELRAPNAYQDLDPLDLLDRNSDNFSYTMDCSSYLNAAIAIEGGVSAAQGQAAANVAVTTNRSFLVVKATLNSPVAMAMSPDRFNILLTRMDRLDILSSLVREVRETEPTAGDETAVRATRYWPVVWTSNEGSSALGGEARLKSKADAGAGVISMKGSFSTGSSMGREISYSKFNTYIVETILMDPARSSLHDLRATVISLVNNTPASQTTQSGDTYMATYELPRTICMREWTIESSLTAQSIAGSVTTSWSPEKKCSLTLRPSETPTATEFRFLVTAPTDLGGEGTFRLPFLLR